MDELIGMILWHKDYGYCKVIAIDTRARQVAVKFCGTGRRANFSFGAIRSELKQKALPVGSFASVKDQGACKIIATHPPGEDEEFFKYVVLFDETGDTASIEERKLLPLADHPRDSVLSRMEACDAYKLHKVLSRHQFLLALEEMHRETAGVEALIGSRTELFPHQAFVASTVINDPVRRFILADEVGLGKTVEAGLVLNDLLFNKPEARVLILTPGALSRQWLCELHISFSAQGFRLADLYNDISIQDAKKLICSINKATFRFDQSIRAIKQWDMVIVDEAHHLLWNAEAYDLVAHLAAKTDGLLLLSAIPARERTDELLSLLRLIDPIRYGANTKTAERFTDLYQAQAQLGQGLRILERDIAGIENGEAAPADLEYPLSRILRTAVVNEDKDLYAASKRVVELAPEMAIVEARQIRDLIVNRYRLSRRIIKNRRSQLVSQDMLTGVTREYEKIPYQGDAFEDEAWVALEFLLEQIRHSNANDVTKRVFFKVAYSSMSDPVSASILAEELAAGSDQDNGRDLNLLASSFGTSYEEYYDLLEDLTRAVAQHFTSEAVERFRHSVNRWIDSPRTKRRLTCLLEFLPNILRTARKIIVFAGAFASASALADELREKLDEHAVKTFTYDLDDAEKESNVLRFRTDDRCRILVSDETGGEGRNFQFVDAIVHYDMPWSVGSIEQRIGRLDRLGRRENVISYVLYKEHSVEDAFVTCMADGFGVFGNSISGLEFMLKDQESAMIDVALELDWEKLASMAPSIAKAANEERAVDDADALTDAASFPRFGRMRFLHELSDSLEQRLEDRFVAYFQSIAQVSSARQYADEQEPNLKLWRLKPDEVRKEPLPGLEKTADGVVAERKGTFSRRVARIRRNLDFFSVGHPLFDAVNRVALERPSGRTFAFCARSAELEPGNYIVAGYRYGCPEAFVADSFALQRRVRRHFIGQRAYCAYRLGDVELLTSPICALVSDALAGKIEANDLEPKGLRQLVDETVPQWTQYLNRILEISSNDARSEYRKRFGFNHDAVIAELNSERDELEGGGFRPAGDIDALMRLEQAINAWCPILDVLGIAQITP